MATTDLQSIIAAWRTVLEGATLSLKPTVLPFTHDAQPAGMVADSYWIEDGGVVNRSSVTNAVEVRIDRLTVWIAKPLNFTGAAQFAALEDLGDDVYRQLIANGQTNGWHVEADTRRITTPAKSELLIASFSFRVDYDFSTAIA